MRMRLPTKAVAWSVGVVMPIMACGMALSLHAAVSPLTVIPVAWRCNHAPNLDPQVCLSAEGDVIRYRIDTADGSRAELTLSKEGALEAMHQAGPDLFRVGFGHAPVPTSGISMTRQAYEDENLTIDQMRDGQSAAPGWAIYSRDARPSHFLIEMCAGSACSQGFQNK